MIRKLGGACVALALLWSGAAVAQNAAPADSAAKAAAEMAVRNRASWTADRVALHVGDLLTVVVDEETAAREKVTRNSDNNRTMNAQLNATLNSDPQTYNIQSGLGQNSRDYGEANRSGDLTAVLTVRITSLEANGVAHIQVARKVNVDGREQNLSLTGVVRPQDVSATHYVLSNRVAEAVIEYKGKKIGPRTGLIGKVLGMLWP